MINNFRLDGRGYLDRIDEPPDGFVLNTRAGPDPEYMVLQSSRCTSISSTSIAPSA
jgi:hypothetical protein